MNAHGFAAFVVTFFILSMTPGPNMLLAMSLGMRYGVRRALWGLAGLCGALIVMAGLSAAGVGALLAASASAFETVRWCGVAYLVWLGVAAWRAPVGDGSPAPQTAVDDDKEAAPARLFRRGVLVAASNPKALVFMTALFPQFIDPAAAFAPQLAALIGAMSVIEIGWMLTYAVGGDRLAARLTGPSAARLLNRVTGGLLVAAGGLLALARRA